MTGGDTDEFWDDDDGELSEPYPGEECGRWMNGRLGQYCTKAGADIGTPQGWDIGFEAAAQAVRLHVLEEAAKVGDWVWTDDDDDCSEDPKPTG